MKKRFSKKRQDELDQLINDIAENMSLVSWERRDFIDCINYLQDALCEESQKSIRIISSMSETIAEFILEKYPAKQTKQRKTKQ